MCQLQILWQLVLRRHITIHESSKQLPPILLVAQFCRHGSLHKQGQGFYDVEQKQEQHSMSGSN